MPISAIFGWFSFKEFLQKPPFADFSPFFANFSMVLVVFVVDSRAKTTTCLSPLLAMGGDERMRGGGVINCGSRGGCMVYYRGHGNGIADGDFI